MWLTIKVIALIAGSCTLGRKIFLCRGFLHLQSEVPLMEVQGVLLSPFPSIKFQELNSGAI